MPLLIFSLLNVAAGGKQELLAPLFQQTAAYFINHPDDVTEEERTIVAKILKPDQFEEKYNNHLADPIKNTFDYYAHPQDIVNYIGVWASRGVKKPLTYLDATLTISSLLMAPIMPITPYGGFEYDDSFYNALIKHQGDSGINLYKPEPLASISTQINEAYKDTISSVPPLRILFSRGLWGCWMPLFCLVLSFAFQKDSLIAFTPILASILFLVISPAASSRYVIPLLFVVQLVIGLGYYSALSKSNSASDITD